MSHLAAHLTLILDTLRTAIAGFLAARARVQTVFLGAMAYAPITPPSPLPPIPDDTWRLLHHRLNRLAARLSALFARWQAGTIPRPRPKRPSRARPSPPYTRLPTARGWINARIPATAPAAGLLHMVMSDPDLPRFVAEAPQSGRLLRPLCRALAIDLPPCLRLPSRPPKPRAPKPKPPPLPPLFPPLQPRILAAARYWKKRTA